MAEAASVLFTHLVASTALRTRLGEDTADELQVTHDRLLTTAMAGHGEATSDTAFQIRVGVSVGDITRQDGDVHGSAVVEAARLCDQAQGGRSWSPTSSVR